MIKVVAGLSLSAGVVEAVPKFQLTVLNSLTSNGFSWGKDINESGQVTGYSHTAQGPYGAFLWGQGTMISLGTLGGNSSGEGINDKGEVAGWSETGQGETRAFIYSEGVMTYLPSTFGGQDSQAFGINNSGQVTGWAATANNARHAFVHSGGSMTDITPLAGKFQAGAATGYDINESGQVAGWFEFGPSGNFPFVYSGTQVVVPELDHYLSDYYTAINDSGMVTGERRSNDFYGAINTNGDLFGLQYHGHRASGSDINDQGQVVGWAHDPDYPTVVGFLYDSRYGMLNLNELLLNDEEWWITEATGINENGQITGTARHKQQGRYSAFILNPIPTPEAGGSLSIFIALGALGLLRLLHANR